MSSLIRSRRCLFALGAIATTGLALLLGGSGLASTAAAATASSPLPIPTSPDCQLPVCVLGFSKNSCDGAFDGGAAEAAACTTADGVQCRTVVVRDNTFKFNIRTSGAACTDPTTPGDARCDETPELDGTVVVKNCFTLRYQQPCRFRGCWGGEFTLYTADGAVGFGTAAGTLGVGSHRAPTNCANDCGDNCEGCYEVRFIPSPTNPIGTWVVDLEGTLNGSITAGTYAGANLCASMQGVLTTPGTLDGGPIDPTEWKYCGTADGVVLAACN